jgi:hypothetical protein
MQTGFELGPRSYDTAGEYWPDGHANGAGPVRDTTVQRSGSACLSSGGASSDVYLRTPAGASLTNTAWCRFYFRRTSTPGITITFFQPCSTTNCGQLAVAATGNLVLLSSTGVNLGATTTFAVDTWHLIELEIAADGVSTTRATLKVNGQVVVNNATVNSSASSQMGSGGYFVFDGNATHTYYFDDFVFNTSDGSVNNSWPGSGSVLLLVPTSDNQRGSWTGGAGGTTNLYDALDNLPPAGLTTETDTSQIESADSSGDNTTDEYIANMTTYTAAGITAADKIEAIVGFVSHSEDVSTGAKTGKFRILSNPVDAGLVTFTFSGTVGGTCTNYNANPTTWSWDRTAVIENPSVTLGTAPTMAVRKTDTGTRVAQVCMLCMYVAVSPYESFPFAPPLHSLQHMIVR